MKSSSRDDLRLYARTDRSIQSLILSKSFSEGRSSLILMLMRSPRYVMVAIVTAHSQGAGKARLKTCGLYAVMKCLCSCLCLCLCLFDIYVGEGVSSVSAS